MADKLDAVYKELDAERSSLKEVCLLLEQTNEDLKSKEKAQSVLQYEYEQIQV